MVIIKSVKELIEELQGLEQDKAILIENDDLFQFYVDKDIDNEVRLSVIKDEVGSKSNPFYLVSWVDKNEVDSYARYDNYDDAKDLYDELLKDDLYTISLSVEIEGSDK